MPLKSLIRGKKSSSAEKKAETPFGGKPAELAAEAVIDFPKEAEKVLPGHYAVRITARPGYDVEINTGGTEWWPCRESVGHFWFDWWPSKPGRTTLSLRVKVGKGRWKKVSERSCTVSEGGLN
jgi:hypothetical protein